MNHDLTPFSTLTDEELLCQMYMRKQSLSGLELELMTRLQFALDFEHGEREDTSQYNIFTSPPPAQIVPTTNTFLKGVADGDDT